MKGLKVNMDMVNCGLLLVVLVLVVMCCVKREGYKAYNHVAPVDARKNGVIKDVLGRTQDSMRAQRKTPGEGVIVKGVKRTRHY